MRAGSWLLDLRAVDVGCDAFGLGALGIARRLRELGFVSGEEVTVLAMGPVGREPLLVQVGYTRFALRRSEAARVQVRDDGVAA